MPNNDSEFMGNLPTLRSLTILNVFVNEQGVQTVAVVAHMTGLTQVYTIEKNKLNNIIERFRPKINNI